MTRYLWLVLVWFLLAGHIGVAHAAISWDAEGNSNWWFDPLNWSRDGSDSSLCPCLPPSQGVADLFVVATDAQINIGTGPWDVTGEGVVYDPDNDPFFAAAASLNYPTGSPAAAFVGSDYGPQHLHRLYISRDTPNQNLLTIKSGDLVIASTTIIGRSGSMPGMPNEGRVNQVGGRVRLPLVTLDVGQSEVSGPGNGVYDYRGGSLEVSLEGGDGIRLSHGGQEGGTNGPGGFGTFVVHNPTSGGYVRTWNYRSANFRGTGSDGVFDPAADPDGVNSGVGITEFHFENGGTRPIQVANQLTINNGLDNTMIPGPTGGTMSSRLDLVLGEAPMVDMGGVPVDLGLFDIDFDLGFGSNGGSINGFGDLDGDGFNDAIFSSLDGATQYPEGATVSATFGTTRYDWTISYNGNISWGDADNSVVSMIEGPGSGLDVVLIGLGSETVAVTGDFNGDSVWDCADIDALTGAIASGSTDLSFDMNGDGQITLSDITDAGNGWLAVGGANNVAQTGGNAFLSGDANLDGVVDGQDFIVWNGSKFTVNSAWCAGDFNADGNVDGQDFIAWNASKFQSSSDSVVGVPEPCATLGLLLFGWFALPRRRY